MSEESRELVIRGADETVTAVEWDFASYAPEQMPGDSPAVVQTYPAPRGKWDFTDGQRIVISFLIWLNIIVMTIGYLAVTGQLSL